MSSVLKLSFFFILLLPPLLRAESRPGGLPEDVNPGSLRVLSIAGEAPDKPLELPLKHTRVDIQVQGFVARATVVQQYANPFQQPIEAVYQFPLPNRAAVDAMNLRVGDKTIRGLIKRRQEAKRIYEQAKSQGRRAGLLEQERPNIFTQSVANILPGEQVEVEITYVDILDFRDEGAFEMVFPMVVGPRYIPGVPTGQNGSGWSPDTDQVPDASRITPPVLKPGQRSGHDIELTVSLDAAVAVKGVHVTSHAVDIEQLDPARRKISLHPSDTLPNKDFILRYQVAGDVPQATLLAHHTAEQGGYFTLIALPPAELEAAETVARDLIFILDTSGSMRGFPLDKSKQAMQRLIKGMRPGDRFNIVRFAGDSATLWSEPRPYSEENARIASRFVDQMRGAGGTEMRKGIIEALRQPSDPERMRIAFLLTDGYVGNERDIFASIEKERRGARVFSLGVGSSVNRHLLDRAAQVGLGEAFYVRQDENADAVVERFYKRVDKPALAHIQVDWNGLQVEQLSPNRIPDLWQGQPVKIHGRYQRGGKAQINISGVLGGKQQDWLLDVELPENQTENALMAPVWARARIAGLMLDMDRGGDREALQEEVTELGLNYRLMTQWTSFVAVEEKVVNQGGEQKTVVQPVVLPEGVDYGGVFGDEAAEAMPAPAPMATRKQGFFSGLFSRSKPAAPQMTAAPTVDMAVAEEIREKEEPAKMSDQCRYQALSVSGPLRFAKVDAWLRQSWADICKQLAGQIDKDRSIKLVILLNAQGGVDKLQLPNGLSADLERSVRKAFKTMQFGAAAAGARIELELQLKR